jgi:hypothetical protein
MPPKQLYELNLPPASWFIGQFVRIITTMEERDESGEVSGQITVLGMVVDSDATYLTLGELSPLDEAPIAHLAIKHADIQMIKVEDPDSMSEVSVLPNKNSIN